MVGEPTPQHPREVGVSDDEPGISEVEPVNLLANEARERLRADGFTDVAIDAWAKAFVAETGPSGTVDEFVAWIASRE